MGEQKIRVVNLGSGYASNLESTDRAAVWTDTRSLQKAQTGVRSGGLAFVVGSELAGNLTEMSLGEAVEYLRTHVGALFMWDTEALMWFQSTHVPRRE